MAKKSKRVRASVSEVKDLKSQVDRLLSDCERVELAVSSARSVATVDENALLGLREQLIEANGLLATALQQLERPSPLANKIWRFLGFFPEPLPRSGVIDALDSLNRAEALRTY